jgi:predicted NAD/FAD-dependent oxidoreductase
MTAVIYVTYLWDTTLAIHPKAVQMTSGKTIQGRAVVLATEGPETARLLGIAQSIDSRGELCLYYAANTPPISEPYLVLNSSPNGWINSLTIPSLVAPAYAPSGRALISVVVIGDRPADNAIVEANVRRELLEWFGRQVDDWQHLKTVRIAHALPAQPPPMPNPTDPPTEHKPGLFVCGEYSSVPGIQWALLSGRRVAERILAQRGSRR